MTPTLIVRALLLSGVLAVVASPAPASQITFQIRGLIDLTDFGGDAEAPFRVEFDFDGDAAPTSSGADPFTPTFLEAFYPAVVSEASFGGVPLTASGSAFNPDVIGLLDNLDGFEGPPGSDEYVITSGVSGNLLGTEFASVGFSFSYFQFVASDLEGVMLDPSLFLPTDTGFLVEADSVDFFLVAFDNAGMFSAFGQSVPGSLQLLRVPEPTTGVVSGLALIGFASLRRRQG